MNRQHRSTTDLPNAFLQLTLGLAIALAAFWSSPEVAAQQGDDEKVEIKLPATFKKPMKIPSDNPLTKGKVELGRKLFFDNRLSVDNKISCATCHDPKHGWAEPKKVATGFGGKKGNRNTPSVLNTGLYRFQFWDGREGSLEGQALGPIANPIEMNLSLDQMVEKLNKIPLYQQEFQKVFGAKATKKNVAKAIAAFERTIVSDVTPYDLFKAGDEDAMGEAEKRGMELFFGQANCSSCHSGPLLSDNAFHNIGVGFDAKKGKFEDTGRFSQTKMEGDMGSFKTPSLRDIARTAPYMHDGSEKTLREVIEFYDQGGRQNPWIDEEIFELGLTDSEKDDLEAFLKSALTGKKEKIVTPPKYEQKK